MTRSWIVTSILLGASALAQSPSTTKQLMVDLIHPASNDILLLIFRGGPKDEKDWAVVRRSALTLAESGNVLAGRGPARDAVWLKDSKLLADMGAAAYKAAQAKDASALAALADPLDASCTACHKQYRPNIFPREGGSK